MIEAMKQWLEALELAHPRFGIATEKHKQAITSLRQAIEQAEKQEPVAWMYDRAKYRENDLRGRQWAFKCVSQTKPYMDEMVRNVTPLYTTPQPQQERKCDNCGEFGSCCQQPQQAEKQEPKCVVILEVFGKDWRLEYMSLPVGRHKLYAQQYTYTTPQPQREPPKFPTMLRKMWSGTEVQDWINENWNKP